MTNDVRLDRLEQRLDELTRRLEELEAGAADLDLAELRPPGIYPPREEFGRWRRR